jgi:UDP-N-acetylmuramate--alanine ligase
VNHAIGARTACVSWPRWVHCVGVGGSGVSALAEYFAGRGVRVTGSDQADSPVLRKLARRGIEVWLGHRQDPKIGSCDCVVFSLAVPESNPELVVARQLGIPCYSYPQMLAYVMARGYGIAVAGTHGKSTTTAMLGRILEWGGLDPTVIVGAEVQDWRSASRVGRGPLVVAEACEYGGNFHCLSPRIAVVLNIECDHLDYYGTEEQLRASFEAFAQRVPADGFVCVNAGCPTAKVVAAKCQAPVEAFGLEGPAQWTAQVLDQERGRYRFRAFYQGRLYSDLRLAVPGRHNVPNALAALAVSRRLGVSAARAARALANFSGCRRRLEVVGMCNGVVQLDDYAHHPTEVQASIRAVREMYPRSKLWCVFQPHQLWRTRLLFPEFVQSLGWADRVVVLPVYPARESTSRRVCRDEALRLVTALTDKGTWARFAPDHLAAAGLLRHATEPGDVLVLMGAGDVWKVGDVLRQRAVGYREAG